MRIATGGGRGKVKSATAGDLDGRHHDPRLIKRRPTRAKLVVLDACNLVCARSTPSEDLQVRTPSLWRVTAIAAQSLLTV